GAQPAGHALGAALLVGEHPVGAPRPGRDGPGPHGVVRAGALLLGVLHRHLLLQQVPEGERHAPEGGPHVAGLPLRPLEDLDPDRHQDPTTAPGARRAAAGAAARARRAEPRTTSPRSTTTKSTRASARLSAVSAAPRATGPPSPSTSST